MFRLRLLGGATIEGADGPLSGRIAQRRQLALLSILALQGDRPTSRDRLLALLWPDADGERARHNLTDCVYLIRKALGEASVQSVGDDLLLSSERVSSDTAEFEERLRSGDLNVAAALYAGPLLDGFHLPDSNEFEHWLEREREAFARAYVRTLEALAERAGAAGDVRAAVEWWRQAATAEPHNAAIALSYARALAAGGDRAGALRWATAHAQILRDEYDLEPDAALVSFTAELRLASLASAGEPAEPDRSDIVDEVEGVGSSSASAPAERGSRSEEGRSGAADAAVQEPPRPLRWLPRASRSVAGRFAAAGVVLSFAAVLLHFGDGDTLSSEEVLDADLVAILPFRMGGAAPELEYLGEGVVELLSAKLGGHMTLRAVEPAASGRLANPPTSRRGALEVARTLGAGNVVLGSVVGKPSLLTLHAALLRVPGGELAAEATVHGGEDALHDLVDRLVAELLVRRAGEQEHRLAQLTSASPSALRTFLHARAAHRRGDYEVALREYARALDADSTFALAALGITEVAGWVGGSGAADARARVVLQRHLDRLSARDRAGYSGRTSPRDPSVMPSVLEELDAVEEALRRWPDHPRLWYHRGDLLMHFGRGLQVPAWQQRAHESFVRALELDPDFAEPVHHLAVVLAESGDTAALRELARAQLARHPDGPVADHLRWWAQHVLGGDYAAAMSPPETMDTDATLRWIGIVAQDYNVAIDEVARLVRVRLLRPGIRDQHLERRRGAFAYALNQGRPAEALRHLDSIREVQPDDAYYLRLGILTALYGDGDRDAAVAAAEELASMPGDAVAGELNRCVLAQWRLANGRSDLDAPASQVGSPAAASAARRVICDAVVRAQRSAADADRGAGAMDELEGLLSAGRHSGLVDDGQSEFAHLALSRLYSTAGMPDEALRAVRRRSFYNGWQPYLAVMLREEARLAAMVGDTAGAVRALRHYVAFRADAEPSRRPHVEQARDELRLLLQSR